MNRLFTQRISPVSLYINVEPTIKSKFLLQMLGEKEQAMGRLLSEYSAKQA
jgi:hypothetical protein